MFISGKLGFDIVLCARMQHLMNGFFICLLRRLARLLSLTAAKLHRLKQKNLFLLIEGDVWTGKPFKVCRQPWGAVWKVFVIICIHITPPLPSRSNPTPWTWIWLCTQLLVPFPQRAQLARMWSLGHHVAWRRSFKFNCEQNWHEIWPSSNQFCSFMLLSVRCYQYVVDSAWQSICRDLNTDKQYIYFSVI